MEDLAFIYSACLGCKNPRCKQFCPCENEIPTVLAALKQGNIEEASKVLRSTNPFPEWTSLLCDHQRQCRGNCIRGIRGEPVDFPRVEQSLAKEFPFPYAAGKENGHRVAIVGAGPSGLSAAVFLRIAGFAVEVFDKEASIGGAVRTGIPSFRFDKQSLDLAYERLCKLGVAFHMGQELSRDDIEALRAKFDEVIVALGAEKENRLSVPECSDIHSALSLLYDVNVHDDFHGLDQCKHVIVMGGGNVAMDASRTLVRAGVKVTLIYRRDEASMPAQRHEIEEAKEDGVVFSTLTNVADYHVDESGRLKGLRLVKMGLGEKDESGRPSFFVIEGSEFDQDCDAFVMAIGEKSALSDYYSPDELTGNIRAIGDCSYGAKNIAAAIKSGRLAAFGIIEKYR